MQNRGDFLPFVSPSLRLDAAVALLSSRLDPSIFLSCEDFRINCNEGLLPGHCAIRRDSGLPVESSKLRGDDVVPPRRFATTIIFLAQHSRCSPADKCHLTGQLCTL